MKSNYSEPNAQTYITIGGKKYPSKCTLRVLSSITERFGSLENLDDGITLNDKDSVDNIIFIILALINAGRDKEQAKDPYTVDWLEDALELYELKRVSFDIYATLTRDNKGDGSIDKLEDSYVTKEGVKTEKN